MRLGSQKLWSAALNMVKTLPELKSLLNLQLFCGKATATPSIHYFIFSPKQRGHTEAVLTVTVQAGGVQSRWYPGHLAFSLQISALNASCDMSMCISTAQARTKRWPRDAGPAFSLQISAQNASCDMSMCISTAQGRTKRWPRDTGPAFSL